MRGGKEAIIQLVVAVVGALEPSTSPPGGFCLFLRCMELAPVGCDLFCLWGFLCWLHVGGTVGVFPPFVLFSSMVGNAICRLSYAAKLAAGFGEYVWVL